MLIGHPLGHSGRRINTGIHIIHAVPLLLRFFDPDCCAALHPLGVDDGLLFPPLGDGIGRGHTRVPPGDDSAASAVGGHAVLVLVGRVGDDRDGGGAIIDELYLARWHTSPDNEHPKYPH